MNPEDGHERARRLIDAAWVEGISSEERAWLDRHLAACDACAARAGSAEAALSALRSRSVPLPPGLAAATKLRVRQRAGELRVRRARTLGFAAVCSVSWAVGVASAPLVWRAFAWLGDTLHLPRPVWILGFAFWWLVPAAVALGLIAWYGSRVSGEGIEDRNTIERFPS